MTTETYPILLEDGSGDAWLFEDGTEIWWRTPERLRWLFEVDWDNDLAFALSDEFNEAKNRLQEIVVRRGRRTFMAAGGKGFEPVPPGQCVVKLLDEDGRYNPYNTDSDLYPNVQPRRYARLRVLDADENDMYDIFAGYISRIEFVSTVSTNFAYFYMEDGLAWIDEQSFVGDLETEIKASEDSDSAIQTILDGINWPHGYSLQDSGDAFPYWWTWPSNSALQSINDITMPLAMKSFIAADGEFICYSPYRFDASVLSLDENDVSGEINLPNPREVVRNLVTYAARGRIEQAGGTVWELDGPIRILADETITIWGTYNYGQIACPADNVANPTKTANVDADGGGADITADIDIVTTKYATTIKFVITNSGLSDGYITAMGVLGNAVTAQNVTFLRQEDTDSQDDFGILELAIDNDLMQDAGAGKDIANWILANLSDPHPFPTITIIGRPTEQFTPDLFSRIDAALSDLYVEGTFEIGYIEHQFLGSGCAQTVATKFILEPAQTISSAKWQFPTIASRTSVLTDT